MYGIIFASEDIKDKLLVMYESAIGIVESIGSPCVRGNYWISVFQESDGVRCGLMFDDERSRDVALSLVKILVVPAEGLTQKSRKKISSTTKKQLVMGGQSGSDKSGTGDQGPKTVDAHLPVEPKTVAAESENDIGSSLSSPSPSPSPSSPSPPPLPDVVNTTADISSLRPVLTEKPKTARMQVVEI